MIITIDGPTASGKSTVGRLLAQKLGFYYLYTGLLYRAVAYLLMKQYGSTLDTIAQPEIHHIDHIIDTHRFAYRYDPDQQERIIYDDEDITPYLKRDTIGQAASILSTNPDVRHRLNDLQQRIANDHNIVIDGRDAGSVVFPHADKKFFLTASENERARRWKERQETQGESTTLSGALSFIAHRDMRDSQRAAAPLVVPSGARIIDNTDKSIEETVNEIMGYCRA